MFASPLKTCPQSSATAGEPVDHPEPLEQLEGQPQRQAHHPEEVATDPLDQRRALALDRVGAGLVPYPPACSAGPRLSSTSGGTTRNSSPIISSSWRRRGDPLARTITSRGSALRVRHSRAPPPSSPRTLPWRPARRSLLPAPA